MQLNSLIKFDIDLEVVGGVYRFVKGMNFK